MEILAINTGSTSVRLALFRHDDRGELVLQARERITHDGRELRDTLKQLVREGRLAEGGAVAHRIVHGGERFTESCLLDEVARREIVRLAPLAPLHNTRALAWIAAVEQWLGKGVPQVGVFDTAFYAGLPAVARYYALPFELAGAHGIRRYGFHGIAHRHMLESWRERGGAGRAISLQLGGGCSITASREAVAQDTSMGFSPLEGLVMATRGGDLDPGVVFHLARSSGWSLEEIEAMLNERAGLLGLSGESGDMRTLLASEHPQARLAVDLYGYRARKYLGGYLAVLGGAEAVLFAGGVGENAPAVRARILEGMEWAGIALDAERNATAVGVAARISRDDSRIAVWVLPVDEERALAREALAVVGRRREP